MNGHIITCQNFAEYERFLEQGFAGVKPIPVKIDSQLTNRKLASKIRTNWDVIADLKRVKAGDHVFLHTEKNIYGPYVTTTTFLESPEMPDCFKSQNLNIGYWLENYDINEDYGSDYFWKVGIKSIDGLTKEEGLDIHDKNDLVLANHYLERREK